jgi:hypothetical protein
LSNSYNGALRNREIPNIEIYKYPFLEKLELLQPERIVLCFGKGNGLLDFGALCYLRRDFGRRAHGKGVRVDEESLDHGRQIHIRLAIEAVVRQSKSKAKRVRTLHNNYSSFLTFVNWCDAREYYDVLNSHDSLREALRAYIGDLHRRVNQNQMTANSARILQQDVIIIIERHYEVDALVSGVNLIKKDSRLIEPTRIPDESKMGKVLEWCECILIGLAPSLVTNRPYPFSIDAPAYLNLPNNLLWAFPGAVWAAIAGKSTANRSIHFDYLNGRVRSVEDVVALKSENQRTQLRTQNLETHARVVAASTDAQHHSRVKLSMLAMKSYLLLLIASSGQSLSVVATLPWSEELEFHALKKNATRQQFRNIKYRAAGTEVFFEVGINHIPLLQAYLKLRKFLLGGKECEHLFFNFGNNRRSKLPQQLSADCAINELYISLHKLDPEIGKVSPREFRAAKADFLIRVSDVASAAVLMQHSEETARKSYSNGSETVHLAEFSTLLQAMERKVGVKVSRENAAETVERSVGNCRTPNTPVPVIDNPAVIPDCTSAEGCLFCEHHHLHADIQDARKLFSARMCIRYRASLRGSHEEFERVFQPVILAIDALLGEMRKHDAQMVDDCEKLVEAEGNLTPYWSAKMRLLTDLERLV